jgi:2-polyprenyl-6-methoxyphenol hydroxylase-like FAD-dependent oxidoreductase
MVMNTSSTTSSYPVVVGGLGPGGAATAIGLARHGMPVVALESAEGTADWRARNIGLRDATRSMLHELTGQNFDRVVAINRGTAALREAVTREPNVEAHFAAKVVDVQPKGDHVDVTYEDAKTKVRTTISASTFIDSLGASDRIKATNEGPLARQDAGPSHAYVTGQYAHGGRFGENVAGVHDAETGASFVIMPLDDGKDSYITYLDLPLGKTVGDVDDDKHYSKQRLLDLYDGIAKRLNLGEPEMPIGVFDARQRRAGSAYANRIIKIGDTIGNPDPYAAAGFNAAITDARDVVEGLTGPGTYEQQIAYATRDIVKRHDQLLAQGRFFMKTRNYTSRTLGKGKLETMTWDNVKVSWPISKLGLAARKIELYHSKRDSDAFTPADWKQAPQTPASVDGATIGAAHLA